ncbi:MAG: DUF420 domain-containing protein [Bacteroidetes bacterium]|nr:DUF420 domain-containing protein [Bacteroidota bacterium]
MLIPKNSTDDKRWLWAIAALSVLLVGVVFLLLYKSQSNTADYNPAIYLLPKLNALLNGSVTLLLCVGFYFIYNKNITYHRYCMLAAVVFSIAFLLSYVTYHYNAIHTLYGDTDHNGILSAAEKAATGGIRSLYFVILITHIIMAATIVPFILITLYRALGGNYPMHKKIARWTLPMWLYVSITGVIVYLMISPYYPIN